jgi:hypothetical protein
MDKQVDIPAVPKRFISGYEVYQSDEFQALCRKFGIVYDIATMDITIHLKMDEFFVTQTYRPERPKAVETTSMHNKEFRTFVPVQADPPEVR